MRPLLLLVPLVLLWAAPARAAAILTLTGPFDYVLAGEDSHTDELILAHVDGFAVTVDGNHFHDDGGLITLYHDVFGGVTLSRLNGRRFRPISIDVSYGPHDDPADRPVYFAGIRVLTDGLFIFADSFGSVRSLGIEFSGEEVNIDFITVAVPEPGVVGLFALGTIGALWRRARMRVR